MHDSIKFSARRGRSQLDGVHMCYTLEGRVDGSQLLSRTGELSKDTQWKRGRGARRGAYPPLTGSVRQLMLTLKYFASSRICALPCAHDYVALFRFRRVLQWCTRARAPWRATSAHVAVSASRSTLGVGWRRPRAKICFSGPTPIQIG